MSKTRKTANFKNFWKRVKFSRHFRKFPACITDVEHVASPRGITCSITTWRYTMKHSIECQTTNFEYSWKRAKFSRHFRKFPAHSELACGKWRHHLSLVSVTESDETANFETFWKRAKFSRHFRKFPANVWSLVVSPHVIDRCDRFEWNCEFQILLKTGQIFPAFSKIPGTSQGGKWRHHLSLVRTRWLRCLEFLLK